MPGKRGKKGYGAGEGGGEGGMQKQARHVNTYAKPTTDRRVEDESFGLQLEQSPLSKNLQKR